ncbi:unnamed protein product [Symbiodinium microadriaticum]|nr:unnamed protein product [Symbiodinium microadriaticum]
MAGAGSLDRGANFLGGTRVGWASVCFEQIDEKDTGDFKYVGSGRGDYEQVLPGLVASAKSLPRAS